METSENTETIEKDLFECIDQFKKLAKEADNPFFKSKYADLNACLDMVRPILSEKGIEILQPVSVRHSTVNGFCNVVETILLHDSGEWIKSCVVLPEIGDMQKVGGAITYARRYTLKSLLSLQDEDDDGETAVGRGKGYGGGSGASKGGSKPGSKRGSKKEEEPAEEPKKDSFTGGGRRGRASGETSKEAGKEESKEEGSKRGRGRGKKEEEPKEEVKDDKPASTGRRGRRGSK